MNGENTRRVRYLTEADYAVRGLCRTRIMPYADYAVRRLCRTQIMPYADYAVCRLCRMQIMPYADYAVRRLCRTQIIQYANYTVCKLCRMRIMHYVHYAYYVRCPRKCAFQKLECTMYRLSDIMFIAVFDKNVRDYTACQGDLYSGKIWKEILDIDKSTSNG